MAIEHYLPIKPISVNECWQGRRYATEKYKKFTADMLKIMPREKMINGFVEVEILVGLKSLVRGDIDNFCKPIIDCLVKRRWIADDRYIQNLKISKIKQKNESISIFIKEIELRK